MLRLVAILAIAALSLSATLTVFAATPTLVTPAIAMPDSTISVSGSGFAAGQSGVLTYNGGVVGDFSASSTGVFDVALTVPDWAPLNQTARVSAKTGSGALVATTTLYLDPTVSAPTLYVPAQAAPGAQVTVDGAGFAAGQTGNLTFNGMVVRTFTAVADGTFGVPFVVPANATIGTDRISAKTATGTLVATITLVIGTNVTGPAVVAPAQAAPGATVTVNGAGLAVNQTGIVTYNGVQEATFAAGSSCAFAVSFAVPSNATVGSTGRISAKSSSGTLIATTTVTIGSGVGPNPTAPPTATPNPTGTPGTPAPTATPTNAPTATPTIAPTPSPTSPPSTTLPNFSHVYVIIFENREYSQVIGSSSAPYINSLASTYGLSTAFYAERHPSEPNYIALTSGGTQGIADDGVYNLGVNNLFSQVTASGRTWKAWQQGYQGNCFAGSSSSAVVDGVGKSGGYVRKHNPAISYTSISGNSSACANITNLASFDPAAASFNFITPNMINDMHDGTVADGDNFLKAFLPKITSSAAFANSVVYVTFDEGTTNTNGGGHIMTIAITPNMTAGYKATATYTHYSMLRTIEDAWGLPRLGNAGSASDMAFPW